MKISPVNPVVHKCIKTYLTKDSYGEAHFYDYDNCEYFVQRTDQDPDMIKFGFNSNCHKAIMSNGGQEMLDELYKGLVLPEEKSIKAAQITLAIDASGLAKTQKVKKTMGEEEANQIRAKNEEIRKERDEACDKIALRFSCFKRDFMSAPIAKAMKMCLEKKDGFQPCQLDYRKEERFWVFGSGQDVLVTFEVNFDSVEDQALARIFLLELADAKRTVMNCPGVMYHDKSFPDNVQKAFPGAIKHRTSNGSISFLVSDPHLKKGLEQPLSQLIGFR